MWWKSDITWYVDGQIASNLLCLLWKVLVNDATMVCLLCKVQVNDATTVCLLCKVQVDDATTVCMQFMCVRDQCKR